MAVGSEGGQVLLVGEVDDPGTEDTQNLAAAIQALQELGR